MMKDVKAETHRRVLERARTAEALLANARDYHASQRENYRQLWQEYLRMIDRCQLLYGVALKHGASDKELKGPDPINKEWFL